MGILRSPGCNREKNCHQGNYSRHLSKPAVLESYSIHIHWINSRTIWHSSLWADAGFNWGESWQEEYHPLADPCLGEGGSLQLWPLGYVCWELCSLWRTRSARDRGAASSSCLSSLLIPEQRHRESQVLSGCGAVAIDWDGNCAVGSVYPSLLSLCTVPNRKAGQPCLVRHTLCLHCWLHSLNSVLNFILKNLERNQVPSDAEIPIIIGNSSPRNSVVTTRSVAVSGFWKALLEPSRHESCPMWAPLREGDFLS